MSNAVPISQNPYSHCAFVLTSGYVDFKNNQNWIETDCWGINESVE